MSYNKLLAGLISYSLLVCILSGCGTDNTQDSNSDHTTVAELDTSSMFTDRDTDASYDENAAVAIKLAVGNTSCDSSAVSIENDTITITEEGTYLLSGSLTNGQIIIDAKNQNVQIIFDNADINCDTSAALYIRQADKVFVTLADGSHNTLSNTSEFVAIDDNNIDAVLFSKKDLTINGSGELTINAAFGHGIVSKDDLVIAGGEYHISAQKHALAGKDSVRIAAGTLELSAGSDGIHSGNTDDEEKGFIYVANGNIRISAGDDGMHSDADLMIADGTIAISKSYEGLEGMTITIDGGNINVTAEDDGLNAAGDGTTSDQPTPPQQTDNRPFPDNSFDKKGGGHNGIGFDQSNDSNVILINGGTLCVNADGDGIDSNGNLTVTGGNIYVYGPTNSGNGALDYAGTATISGGTLVAVGASGMAQNFSTDSTQGCMLVTVSDTLTEGELSLTDSNGNVLVSCSPSKGYNSVAVSCPKLSEGETYTLTTGDTTPVKILFSIVPSSASYQYSDGLFPSHPAPD